MWNRGLAETVIPPVERFQKDTGLKVALDWYWWFKEMPGTFYPDYWPPREGAEKFKADVRRLKKSGNRAPPALTTRRAGCVQPLGSIEGPRGCRCPRGGKGARAGQRGIVANNREKR
jgi:hypothetical protein